MGAELTSFVLCVMVSVTTATSARTDVSEHRVGLGVNGAPAIVHGGFHVQYEWSAVQWEHGDLGLGALFATHFHVTATTPQQGVTYASQAASLRLDATVGHTFALASRRVRVGTHLFFGPSLRVSSSSLRDAPHDVDLAYKNAEPLFEVGASVSVGWRLLDHFGLGLSIALPLWVAGSTRLIASWLAAPPFIGLTAIFSL